MVEALHDALGALGPGQAMVGGRAAVEGDEAGPEHDDPDAGSEGVGHGVEGQHGGDGEPERPGNGAAPATGAGEAP